MPETRDLANRALAAALEGQLAEAARLARDALSTDPQDPAAMAALGLVQARQNKPREATPLLAGAIAGGVAEPHVIRAYGQVYARMNGLEQVFEHLGDLLAAQPDNGALRLALAEARFEHGDAVHAIALCEAGIASGDETPALLLIYGTALRACDRLDDAIAALSRYVELAPHDPDGHYMRGISLLAAGQVPEARQAFQNAMAEQPFHPWSFYSYMRSGRVTDDEPLVAKFDQLEILLRTADDQVASFWQFGMGKAFEDLGRYDDAWAAYVKGGARQAKAERYRRIETEQKLARLKALFSRENLAKLSGLGDPDARPVFIVGMPRSGSTLTEQVLAGHPQMTALGELLELAKLCDPWVERSLPIEAIPWQDIGQRYLALTAARTEDAATRIVDKGLHNFMHIGFIHVLFPNATILHTVRDPLDTCVSCLSLRFAGGHAWANRTSDMAHYYRQYRELMAHWDDVLPGRVIEARYEDLAHDFEPQARRLIEACGLPWDPACLAFQYRDRAVRTASAAQVRKGIGTSSIGRWKRFETHLGDLKENLADYL